MINFDLSKTERQQSFATLLDKMEDFYTSDSSQRVNPVLNVKEIAAFLNSLQQTMPMGDAIRHVIDGLKKYTVHTTHPMYFGLFNPRANVASVMADMITALHNPQLAAWSHAPFAVEVERMLINEFGRRFGYEEGAIDGVFTSGGAEANLTALLAALTKRFPTYGKVGLLGIRKQPIVYCSSNSHHSLIKAAKVAGLGFNSIKTFQCHTPALLDIESLERQIQHDFSQGHEPLMIVATMGATGAGDIEPIHQLSEVAIKYGIWLHADAAYGGAAILSDSYKHILRGIEKADSITFDAHKWMSVAMSASMFITRDIGILGETFSIAADYMPKEASDLQVHDPFTHSIQWSRRFIGLKLYMSLLTFGWTGYKEVIDHQFRMGELLREKLARQGWEIYNNTPLPVVCFGTKEFSKHNELASMVCNEILQTGKAWLSVFGIHGVSSLRACITNYLTQEGDVDNLVSLLNATQRS